jgi:hypothetical protein
MIAASTRPMKQVAIAALLSAVISGCGEAPHARPVVADHDRPASHEAADRARAEAKAAGEDPVSDDGKHWGGWRYKGDRDDCFFIVGRRCFTDQKQACAAAACPKGRCRLDGAGPASVTCAK